MVSFNLQVDRKGSVTSCLVSRSSGHADLDEITCEKLQERARFLPVRNERGEAVASEYNNTVRWEIPDGYRGLAPMGPWSITIAFVVEADGSVSSCKVVALDGNPPRDLCAVRLQKHQPKLDAAGNAVRSRVTYKMESVVEELPED